MCIFQNSSNKVIGLRVKMPATADNTAYTLRAHALALRVIAPFGRNVVYAGNDVRTFAERSPRRWRRGHTH